MKFSTSTFLILAVTILLQVSCGKQEVTTTTVAPQPEVIVVTPPAVAPTPEEIAKTVADHEEEYRKLEYTLSKLTDSEYEALKQAGMVDWKAALQRHKALKKLTEEDLKNLEIDDKMSLENGD